MLPYTLIARSRAIVFLACAVAASPVAMADIDWSAPDWGGLSPNAITDLSQMQMSARALRDLNDAVSGDSKPARSKKPARSVLDAPNTSVSGKSFFDVRGTEQLASLDGAKGVDFVHRSHYYEKIIWSFDQNVERLYGLPRSNLATGMTALLAGGYAASNNKEFPESWIKPLYQQAEKLMTDNPKVQNATIRGKAVMYQVLVGVGMHLQLVQADLQKNPDPAKERQLRNAGAEVLRGVFGADADKIQFSSSGLRVR